jgi:hypothetical protein
MARGKKVGRFVVVLNDTCVPHGCLRFRLGLPHIPSACRNARAPSVYACNHGHAQADWSRVTRAQAVFLLVAVSVFAVDMVVVGRIGAALGFSSM